MNKFSVLVVDDNLGSQEFFTAILENAGYEVFTASNGAMALDILKYVSFDLVITSSEIPEFNGQGLCRRIRAQETDEYTYIILHSSRSSKTDIAAGLAAGADRYLTRPIDEPELLASLKSAVRILSMQKALRGQNDELRILCTTDHLTGSYNRYFLESQFSAEIERCLVFQQSLSVILCDVDHFKSINDCFGYVAADHILTQIVNLLEKTLRRGTDWICRYGGDEFLIFLPNTKLREGYMAAQRMKQLLSQELFVLDKRSVQITASFGVSGLNPPCRDISIAPESLIEKSCQSLHHAKMEGGNRVRIYHADSHLIFPQKGNTSVQIQEYKKIGQNS